MFQFPQVFWQHSQDECGSPRFTVDTANNTAEEPSADSNNSLESLRCDVIVDLSNRLTEAAIAHPHLAPFLMDGLDHALEGVRLLQDEEELWPIQHWLSQEIGKQMSSRKRFPKNDGKVVNSSR